MAALCPRVGAPIHGAPKLPGQAGFWPNFHMWHGWCVNSHCCRPMVAHGQSGGNLGGRGVAQSPTLMVWEGLPHGASPHTVSHPSAKWPFLALGGAFKAQKSITGSKATAFWWLGGVLGGAGGRWAAWAVFFFVVRRPPRAAVVAGAAGGGWGRGGLGCGGVWGGGCGWGCGWGGGGGWWHQN